MTVEKQETATIPPPWVAVRPRLSVNLSLRQIMLLTIYFAVGSLIGNHVYNTESPASLTLLGVWVGLGMGYLGIWLAVRLGSLAIIGWILFILGYTVATASMMGLLAIPAIPILIGVIIYLHIQHRRNQQNGLLWVLSVAANRQIPLAPGVEAYSLENRGIFQERTHSLAALLVRGQSLSEAIGRVPRVVPWDAPLLIRVGEQTGRLAQGLQEAAESRSKRHHTLRDVFGRIGYLLSVLAVTQGIIGFNLYFIIPKFEAIFRDFSVDLPVATVGLIRASRYLVDNFLMIFLAQLALFVFLALALARGGPQAVPIFGRLFRLRHKSLILRTLALVVDAGQPLDRGFDEMTRSYPSKRIRKKIKKATALIRSGVSWTDALGFVRLILASDGDVLDAAARAGNLPWALRALAETGERRFAYRLQIGSHLLFLFAMIFMGLLVLFNVVALFTPLVTLIERLSE